MTADSDIKWGKLLLILSRASDGKSNTMSMRKLYDLTYVRQNPIIPVLISKKYICNKRANDFGLFDRMNA